MSYRGKHRKMSAATRTIARVAIAGIALGAPVAIAAAPKAAPAAPATGVTGSNPNGDYTVVAGDTLSKIAQQFKVEGGYKKLQELNKPFIPNADLILVGQKIATK